MPVLRSDRSLRHLPCCRCLYGTENTGRVIGRYRGLMWGRRVLVFALLGVAPLLLVGSAGATPGGLDPSFGSGGVVTTTIGPGGSWAHALAVQSDGKILAGGETSAGSALARYNLDGSLDTSFGSGGIATTAIGIIRALVLQPDGKIVVAGESSDGSEPEFALARYNLGGSLDMSFGTGGKVLTPIAAGGGVEAYAIALQMDGKIVVGGQSGDGNNFVITRYNPDGSLDTTFGTGGVVMTATGYVRALVVQPDGKIVAAGTEGCCGDAKFALARYNTNGTLDATFGTSGIVTMSPPSQGVGYAVALQPNGKLVIGGEIDSGILPKGYFGLVRFNSDGTLDTNFGENGLVMTPIGSDASAAALAQQPDGKLVLAGYSTVGSTHEFALVRYNADGSPDAGFGTSGAVTTPIGAHGSTADALALEPDGTVVAAGGTETGSNDTTGEQFALARYLVTSTLSITKDGNGSGLVTSDPAGIECGATCSTSVAGGPVTLAATPAVGSSFTGWVGGGCSGAGTCQVEMSSDQAVTATFSLIPETLTVTRLGTGSGKVNSNPVGLNCGSSCSHAYVYGTTVTLTVMPASWSTFKGWSGACSGAGTCILTMKQAQSTAAMFAAKAACIVPKVERKSLETARRRISRTHCQTGKISRRSSTIKRGLVISQKPRPRERLHNGAKVNLVISKGRRT